MMYRRKIRHYEVQYLQIGETCDDAFEACKKKECHERYLTRSEFPDHLPIQDTDLSLFIGTTWYLTGMIEIPSEEGGTHCGTCFVQKIERITNRPCPCPACRCGGDAGRSWGRVTVLTALCVVKEESDAQRCRVRLFYDGSGSRDKEKKLSGLKSHSRDEDGDWCAVTCATHDLDLLDGLENKLQEHWTLGHSLKTRYQDSGHNLAVVVSHPHGGPKRLSLGQVLTKHKAREMSDYQAWCYYSYDVATCDGSSGGPVYVLGKWNDGFGYWFGHAHNHSGVDINGLNGSTVGVESKF